MLSWLHEGLQALGAIAGGDAAVVFGGAEGLLVLFGANQTQDSFVEELILLLVRTDKGNKSRETRGSGPALSIGNTLTFRALGACHLKRSFTTGNALCCSELKTQGE